MAEVSRKLVCTFTDAEGKEVSLSYSYISEQLDNNDVKALTTGIIANGSIFEKTPVTVKSAKVVITNENDIDITN